MLLSSVFPIPLLSGVGLELGKIPRSGIGIFEKSELEL
jgi:hypothetical protein